ncbi:MAG: methionyl-tRNA formyltransferase, partial [Synergistaceae bacterium]|nr:methionyl-tRNA formyltransferase [Synergistaceae bacterium]
MMNIWFTGTGQFAALCLDALTRRGVTFTRIITGNPTRSGRNNKENPSPVEIMAANLGLDVMRTGKLSENQELISALDSENPDVIFVI